MSVAGESGSGVGTSAIAQAPQTQRDASGQQVVAAPGGGNQEDGPPAEPYYWETGGNASLDFWGKIRHQFHFGGVKALSGAEAIGEVVADTLGLNDSKYQYVIDALEADKYRQEREEREEAERRQMEEEQVRQQQEVVHAQPTDVGEVELGQVVLPPSTEAKGEPSEVVDVPLS